MGDAKANSGSSDSMKKGGRGLVIGGLIIIIILLGVIVLLLLKPWDKKAEAQPANADEDKAPRGYILTEDNTEEVLSQFSEEIPSGIPRTYTVTQNPKWEFPNGASESSNAYVENDEENETPVYFDVVVDATGETVYSSPILELGAKLENIKLDKELPKGDYQCTMTYHLVDENQNTLTTVSVGLELSVEN